LVARSAVHGAIGFTLFAVGHWLCDLLWCGLVGYLSYRGRTLLGGRFSIAIATVCALALIGFGGRFAYDAIAGLLRLLSA
jgi:threonine/homoserine/homoserine lactone efflux protein